MAWACPSCGQPISEFVTPAGQYGITHAPPFDPACRWAFETLEAEMRARHEANLRAAGEAIVRPGSASLDAEVAAFRRELGLDE
jgi:hypothetical protein